MRIIRPLLTLLLPAVLLASALRAQTHATWTGNVDSNWTGSGANWTPMNIPNGSTHTATFDAASGSNAITISSVGVAAILFTSDALANTFTISSELQFRGAGIVNDSAATQTFINNNRLYFYNASSAGTAALTNRSSLSFLNTSSAGSAAIQNDATLSFWDSASAGTASIINGNTLGFEDNATAGSAVITNNGTLRFLSRATGGSAAVTNGADGIIDLRSSHISNQSFGSLAGGGTLQLGGNLTVGSLNASTTFSGIIEEYDYQAGLTKTGTGTLTLTSDIQSFGNLTIDGGTVALGASAALGHGSGVVTVNNGSTLDLGGNTGNVLEFHLNHGTIQNGTINADYGGTLYLGEGTVNAVIGLGTVEKRGAGTVTLTAANTYGATNVVEGTLVLSGDGTLGASDGHVGIGGGTLDLGGKTHTTPNLYMSGGTLQNGTLNSTDMHYLDAGTVTASLGGTGGLIKNAGTLTLAGANTYSGGTAIFAGTLALADDGTLGSGHVHVVGGTLDLGGLSRATGAVTLYDGAIVNGTLTAPGFEVQKGTVGAALAGDGIALTKTTAETVTLTGTNTYTGGTAIDAGTLQIGAGGATGSVTGNIANQAALVIDRSGAFDYAGVISGTGTLAKQGAGTLTLSGASTYTGATTVSAGTLLVNGSLAGTAVTVADGATLGGSGTLGGFTALAGGATLAPGTLTFAGGLRLDDGAVLDLELGAISDLILLTGGTFTSAASAGGITLNLADAGGFTAGAYTLLDYSALAPEAVIGLDLAGFTLGSVITGYDYSLDLFAGTLRLTATSSAIPEPSTCAALAGALALGCAAWRRRRRHA